MVGSSQKAKRLWREMGRSARRGLMLATCLGKSRVLACMQAYTHTRATHHIMRPFASDLSPPPSSFALTKNTL
jgi:hypothetical protein